jgi:hypothetical protein
LCFLQLNETYQKPTILLKKSSNIYLVFNSKTFLSRIKSIYNFALSNVHLHILKCIHYSGITRSCRNSPLNNKQPNTKTKLGQCSSTAAITITKDAIFIKFYCYLRTLLSTILDKLLNVQFCYESKWDRIATVSTDFQEFFFSFQTKREVSMTFDLEKEKLERKKMQNTCAMTGSERFAFFASLFAFRLRHRRRHLTFQISNRDQYFAS